MSETSVTTPRHLQLYGVVRSHWKLSLTVFGVVLALLVGTIVWFVTRDESGPSSALREFTSAWQRGKLDTPEYANADGKEVASAYSALLGELSPRRPAVSIKEIETSGDAATGELALSWKLPGDVSWEYTSKVSLKRGENDAWRVQWSPTIVHPSLEEKSQFTMLSRRAQRGEILDARGDALMTQRRVVDVGVVPADVQNAERLAANLGDALSVDGVDTSTLPTRISQAGENVWVPIVTLRSERYDEVKPEIYHLPGVRFREGTLSLGPSRTFARAVLGRVGPVTKEIMDANPGKYEVGDEVGLNGVSAQYDKRLSGSPSVEVGVAPASNDSEAGSAQESSEKGESVARLGGDEGKSVQLTLDSQLQSSAESALSTASHQGSMVVIRISDSTVVAAANSEDTTYNTAFLAQVPPGSTFKMVSGLGYLREGVSIDQTVSCPKRYTVEGRSFKNDHDFALGDVPLRQAFSRSCNTAFASLAPKLGVDGLADTAHDLGVGREYSTGLPGYTGSVERTDKPQRQAAAAFGQGGTVVSPLSLAAAAAAVARGQWQAPYLVADPKPELSEPGPKLDAGRVAALQTMMREVVTQGTATQLASLPGAPVHGKTGTAEYGTEDPPRSHGWFIGYRGDYAFAVFLDDAGSSAPAVNVTKAFLQSI